MTLSRAARRLLFLPLLLAACAPPVPVPLTPSPEPDATPPGEPLSSQWWSVRIHTDEDPTLAQEVASGAVPRFDEPVDVLRRGGQSHVHVGTFPREELAQAFLAEARAAGYRSAAIVRIGPPTDLLPEPAVPEAP